MVRDDDVFQMMKGATEEQRKEWKMLQDQHFVWLPCSEKTVEGSFFFLTLISSLN